MKHDILVDPRDYSLLIIEIRLKGSAYRRDQAGKICEIIFDLDGLPHSRDQPDVYLKWQIKSLEDLALVITLMESRIEVRRD